MKKILIVDDERNICDGVEDILTKAGFEVKKAFSGEEAVLMNEREGFDLILMDLIMPGMDGADACAQIRKLRPKTKIVAISGSPAGPRVEKFIRNGGGEVFLYKPFGRDELIAGVERALAQR